MAFSNGTMNHGLITGSSGSLGNVPNFAPIKQTAVNYTLLPTDTTIVVTSPNVVIYLPILTSLTNSGKLYVIYSNNVANVLITTTDGSLINGEFSVVLNGSSTLTVAPDGLNNWFTQSLYVSTTPPTAKITGYNANAQAPYPSGLLLIANNQPNGILIGTNGNSYNITAPTITPSQIIIAYLDCNIINTLYKDKGLLILASNAISGDVCILLGNNGSIYNIIYDGTMFITTTQSTSNVGASSPYPSGILLSKVNATSGNSALLFGSDNKIYKILIA